MSGQNHKSYDERRLNDILIVGGEFRTGNMLSTGREQDIDEESSVQNYVLGTRKYLDHGERVFVYGHTKSDNAMARGRPAVAYNTGGTELGTRVGAQIQGADTVPWRIVGAGGIAANQLDEGYIFLQGGFVKRIRSHEIGDQNDWITLTLWDRLTDADLAAGRYGMLIENKYANVFSRGVDGSIPGLAVGISILDIQADYYAWFQVKGPCGVISSQSDKGNADGEAVIVHGVSAGDEVVLQTGDGYQVIGHLLPMNTVSWENENFMLVNLNIE